jgi:transcriptional regulator with XRE-family HTH domain
MSAMTGEELKEKRTTLGLTQAQLAEILEVKPNTVARWERGILTVPKAIELALETVERNHKKPGKKSTMKKGKSN